jgi:hypothetical protein
VLDYIIPKTTFIWYQAQQEINSHQPHTLHFHGPYDSNMLHLKKKHHHSIVCFEHFKYTNMISYMPSQDFWLDGGFSECRVLLLKHCGHQFMSDWFQPSLFPKVKYILYHDVPCDPYMVAHFIKRNPKLIIENVQHMKYILINPPNQPAISHEIYPYQATKSTSN